MGKILDVFYIIFFFKIVNILSTELHVKNGKEFNFPKIKFLINYLAGSMAYVCNVNNVLICVKRLVTKC